MGLRPAFVEEAAHPRVALFVFEGVLITAAGVVLQLLGRFVYEPLVSFGGIAILVGGATAVFGAVGYAAVMYATPDTSEPPDAPE